MLAPTLDFKIGHVLNLPFDVNTAKAQESLAIECVEISNLDWASAEAFWGFEAPPFVAKMKTKRDCTRRGQGLRRK